MKYLSCPFRVVALKDSDSDSLGRSASGGAFALMARAVVGEGGYVFGSRLFDDGYARHVCARSETELADLQGSKYVQSLVEDTYEECLEHLRDGRSVLYSGTPCQIYALRAFLERHGASEGELDNLTCADLICHGTPEPELFKLHQDWLSEKVNADDGLHGYVFRSKLIEWGLYYYYYYYRHGRRHEVLGGATEDPYYKAFLDCGIFKKGCYKCPFACKERVGDITLGDYWGIEQEHPSFDTSGGCSAVLVNTEKGEKLFEACMEDCIWLESSFDQVARHNINLLRPSICPDAYAEKRPEIERAINADDYRLIFDDLLKIGLTPKQKLKKMIPLRLFLKLRLVRGLFPK